MPNSPLDASTTNPAPPIPSLNPTKALPLLTSDAVPNAAGWLASRPCFKALTYLAEVMCDLTSVEAELDGRYAHLYATILSEIEGEAMSRARYIPQQSLKLLGAGSWRTSRSMLEYWKAVAQRARGPAWPIPPTSSISSTGSGRSKGVDLADFAIYGKDNEQKRVTAVGEFKMPSRLPNDQTTSFWGSKVPALRHTKDNRDRCRQGLAQALWYVHGANEIEGTVLGIFILGSMFRRILVGSVDMGRKTFLVEVLPLKQSAVDLSTSFEDFFGDSASDRQSDLLFHHALLPNDLLAPAEEKAKSAATRLYLWYTAAINLANTIPLGPDRHPQEVPIVVDADGIYHQFTASEEAMANVAMDTETAAANIKAAKKRLKTSGNEADDGEGNGGSRDGDDDDGPGGGGGAGKGRSGGAGRHGSGSGKEAGPSRITRGSDRRSASPNYESRGQGRGKGKERAQGPAGTVAAATATDSVLSWREGLPKSENQTSIPIQELPAPGESHVEGAAPAAEDEEEEEFRAEGSELGNEDDDEMDIGAMAKVMDILGHRIKLVSSEEMDELVASAQMSEV